MFICGNPVVIRTVAAIRAPIFVQSLVSVRLAYHTAFRTGLACVTRVNHDDGMSGLYGLVFNHLPQLAKRPTDLRIPVAFAYLFGGVTDTFEFSVVKHSHKTNQTIVVTSAEHRGRPHQSLVQSFRIFSRNPTDRAKQSLRLLFGELLLFGIFDSHGFAEYYEEGPR